MMTDEAEDAVNAPPTKLTRTKQRWAREGHFLTGRVARLSPSAWGAAGGCLRPSLEGRRPHLVRAGAAFFEARIQPTGCVFALQDDGWRILLALSPPA